jgi:hypothetical protein
MKLVKEHINEKFSEDSDPISDMGIGKLSLKEIRKILRNVKQKFKELLPTDQIRVEMYSYFEEDLDVYEVTFKLKSGYHLQATLFGSQRGVDKWHEVNAERLKSANIHSTLPKRIGWAVYRYYSSNNKAYFVELENYDELIKDMIKCTFSGDFFDGMINKETALRDRLAKKLSNVQISIDSTKILKQVFSE